MEPLNNIREQLRQYVDGKIAYADFRPWIAGVYFDCLESGEDSDRLRLCRAIEWELAELSERLSSEELVKQALVALIGDEQESKTVGSVTIVKVRSAGAGTSVLVGNTGSGTGTVHIESNSGSFLSRQSVSTLEQRP